MAGITKERAFTQLKSRAQAAELRSQMQAAVAADRITISAPNVTSVDEHNERAGAAYLPLYPVCAPLDIEECMSASRYDSGSGGSASTRLLHDFPPDDLELTVTARDDRCIDPVPGLPSVDASGGKKVADWSHIDGPTMDIISAYQKSHCIVHRRYEQYSFGHVYERLRGERSVLAHSLPKQMYEIDALLAPDSDDTASQRASFTSSESTSSASAPGTLLSQSQGDCMLPGAAARLNATQLDANNSSLRAQNRFGNVLQLLPLPVETDVIERRATAPLPQAPGEIQGVVGLMLRVHAFSMPLQVEPLFLSLAVYDAKRRRRLSENFHVDFNGPELLAMIQQNRVDYIPEDCMSKAKCALLSLSEVTEHMCILIRVVKILQAVDVSEAGDIYSKEDPNHAERQRLAAGDFCSRLGAFRMPLAWTFLDLAKLATGDATQPQAGNKSSTSGTTSLVSSLYAPNLTPAAAGAHSLPVTPTKAANLPNAAAAAAATQTPAMQQGQQISAYAGDDTDSIVSVERDYPCGSSGRPAAGPGTTHDLTLNSDTSSFVRVGSGTSFNKFSNAAKRSLGQRPDGGSGSAAAGGSAVSLEQLKANMLNFLSCLQPTTITLNNFYRMEADRVSDDELLRLVCDAARGGTASRRLKVLPARITLELCNPALAEGAADAVSCVSDLPNQISPERRRLSPFYASADSTSLVVRQLYDFPVSPVYTVNTIYKNTLFIYPKWANLSGRTLGGGVAAGMGGGTSARNISIRVELWRGRLGPVEAVYGRSSEPALRTAVFTAVQYHHKSPQLYDEIKVRIPVELCDEHHLLFTFYHVSCKPDAREVHTPIGYTWIPLFANKTLAAGDFELPISLEQLPDSYYHMPASVHLPNLRWLDNHRACFGVSLKPVTSVHPLDSHLDTFLRAHFMFRHADMDHAKLQESILNLTKSRPEPLVQFLYVLLEKLLDLVVNPTNENGSCVDAASCSFCYLAQLAKILGLLTDLVDAQGRSTLLTTFVTYHRVSPQCQLAATGTGAGAGARAGGAARQSHTGRDGRSGLNNGGDSSLLDLIRGYERSSSARSNANASSVLCDQHSPAHFQCGSGGRLLHEEIAALWNQAAHATKQMACLNAWFFLELMIKSMAEYLLSSGRLYLPRKLRFSQQFCADALAIVHMLAQQAIQRLQADRVKSTLINRALAFFVRDAFTLMDRTLVLTMFKEYNELLGSRVTEAPESACAVMLLRIEFNRIVCSHEHFVTLNMAGQHAKPIVHSVNSATNIDPKKIADDSRSPSVGSRGSVSSAAAGTNKCGSVDGSTGSPRRSWPPTVGQSDLTAEYRTKHYLAGQFLSDVASVLEPSLCVGHGQPAELQEAAVNSLCAVFVALDSDQRLQPPAGANGGPSMHATNLKHTVATLMSPLLGIVLDSCGVLFDPHGGGAGDAQQQRRWRVAPSDDVLRAISLATPQPRIEPNATNGKSLSLHCTQGLLSAFCWVLKNTERAAAARWMRELGAARLTQLLDVLQLCISCFEYSPRVFAACAGAAQPGLSAHQQQAATKAALRELIVGSGQASKQWLRNRHSARNRNLDALQESEGVRWRKDAIQQRGAATGSGHAHVSWTSDTGHRAASDVEALISGNLSTEVTLVVLDSLELILQVVRSAESSNSSVDYSSLVPMVVRVVLHALSCEQSVRALNCVLGTQRALVLKYSDVFFEQETDLCNELCLQLLRRGACPLPQVRSQAAASLYILMRHSYEVGASFPRVKMQITVALSQLVSTSDRAIGRFSEENLRRCLKTVLLYAENDAYHAGGAHQANGTVSPSSPCATVPGTSAANFSEQVKDLVFNLHMILSDTVKMKELHNDREMLIDLMYRIAKGYENSPDLRVTWLANMAAKHEESGNWPEAGMCYVHAAALVSEYLRMMHRRDYLPVGANSFVHLTENALEECAVSADVVAPHEDGVCESRHFTADGLLRLMHLAVECLSNAHLYELQCHMYELIAPMLHQARDVQRLAECHERAARALEKVEQETERQRDHNALWHLSLITSDKRSFGTYFRVGFYGALLADLDGLEFVYREPAITKLHEISHRLECFYAQRLGEGRVEIVKDSNVVHRQNLDQNKAYLQITYVEPYLDKWQLRRRRTYAERNCNLRRFVYYTPVARDGRRAHSGLAEQCKRRTVLTLAHALPYIKTRVLVVGKDCQLLTPIEVAIEDVRKRTRDLAAAAARQPCDAKMLQMVLQGCIGATVNQGPIEVANVFLAANAGSGESDRESFIRHQHQLRIAFKQFSAVCADALKLNKKLIGADRSDYQRELERNYFEFTAKLTPMVSTNNARCRRPQQTSDCVAPHGSLDGDVGHAEHGGVGRGGDHGPQPA